MKVVVAPDSFKGSLTAVEAAQAMQRGIHAYDPKICVHLMPVADGGEGTTASLVTATGGHIISTVVQDPLGRETEAAYGILGDGKTAVIEIAAASGLGTLKPRELDPLIASTYGTGQLIRHALEAGIRRFTIGLGGSATNDGGAGLLQALGMKLLDGKGVELPRGGGALHMLQTIDAENFDQRILESTFLIACDVDNPFTGPLGASYVFGPQKGASPEMVERLDRNLHHYATVVEMTTGIALHASPGAGAAGGAGGAFQAFFPATMEQGISVVLDAISFRDRAIEATLIVTGEGKTDRQTLAGKAPFGIAKVARSLGIPVILISGDVEKEDAQHLTSSFTELHAIVDDRTPVEQSMENAAMLLQTKTHDVIKRFLHA